MEFAKNEFGKDGTLPIDLHNAVARHVKPVCRRLGLPEVSWHDLGTASGSAS